MLQEPTKQQLVCLPGAQGGVEGPDWGGADGCGGHRHRGLLPGAPVRAHRPQVSSEASSLNLVLRPSEPVRGARQDLGLDFDSQDGQAGRSGWPLRAAAVTATARGSRSLHSLQLCHAIDRLSRRDSAEFSHSLQWEQGRVVTWLQEDCAGHTRRQQASGTGANLHFLANMDRTPPDTASDTNPRTEHSPTGGG